MKKFLIISIVIMVALILKNWQHKIYSNFYNNISSDDIIKFYLNDEIREYLLHIPKNIQPYAPLVFVLHGLGSTNSFIKGFSQMDNVADKNGFVVCYPQGTRTSENTAFTKKGTSFWNVGYDIHENETVDDLSFIKSLAIFLQKEYDLDPEKTFVTGMSNGGDMSYLLGCEASNIFKAIAPITGCMMLWIYESCIKNDPVPVFHVHGTKDSVTYYNGDVENKYKWGAYVSVESSIKFWTDRNQCTVSSLDTLLDIDKTDGSYIIREKHLDGINKNEVWFYKIINGGHEWPMYRAKHFGNRDINTSEEIWNFFSEI